MQKQKSPRNRSIRLLLSTALVAGVVGYGLSETGLTSITPSYAEAVKVDVPEIFSFGDVVEAVSPAVVSVRVEASLQPANAGPDQSRNWRGHEFFERFFEGPQGEQFRGDRPRQRGPKARSQGSGFFVSEDGYVVTNNHVIEGGSRFIVVLGDGTEYEATLVGADPRTDLAVLKVEADSDFTYVEFGDDRPRIGDWVVAVGNPFGLGGTVTAGIVSAHGREIGAGRYDDFIQIDAAINKGNSGGPAFNLQGEVVGINTAIFSPSGGNVGIAFAIPAVLADEIVNDLIEDGSVTRGWLGVQIQPVTEEIAESLGLEFEEGAIVTSAQSGSPAEEAGVKSGDIISAVNGKSIDGPKKLAKVIAGLDPDSDAELTVWRDGKSSTVTVKLGELDEVASAATRERGPGKSKNNRLGKMGLALAETTEGLVVQDVRPNSSADRRGFQVGDVISAINGDAVQTTRELRKSLKDARDLGRKSALLHVQRGERTLFVPLPLGRG